MLLPQLTTYLLFFLSKMQVIFATATFTGIMARFTLVAPEIVVLVTKIDCCRQENLSAYGLFCIVYPSHFFKLEAQSHKSSDTGDVI